MLLPQYKGPSVYPRVLPSQVRIKRINTARFPKRMPKVQALASKGDRGHAPHTPGTFLDLNSLRSPSLDFGAIQT